MNGALVELAVEISDCLTNGDWRSPHLVNFVKCLAGDCELGELSELPHWRVGNVTPRCFVAGSQ